MKYTIRGFREEVPDDKKGKQGDPINFIASTEGIKRDGMDLSLSQWDLSNYKRNPVFLWAHDYLGRTLPIGRAKVTPDPEAKVLRAQVWFDQADPFAVEVERKYRDGFLNAVSVGWKTITPEGKMLHEVTKDQIVLDLLDISGVPVPGDADALMERFVRSLEEDGYSISPKQWTGTHTTQALPPHRSDLANLNRPWLPAEEIRSATPDELHRMAAWRDGSISGTSPSAYRFLHHLRTGEAVWYGVAAAMAELYTDTTAGIPDGDRKGVYTHLARHYAQFGKEPPEYLERTYLSLLSGDEIRGLFSEGEPELFPEAFAAPDARKGAVLSKRNLSDLDTAITLLTGIRERAVREEESDETLELSDEAKRALEEMHARLVKA